MQTASHRTQFASCFYSLDLDLLHELAESDLFQIRGARGEHP